MRLDLKEHIRKLEEKRGELFEHLLHLRGKRLACLIYFICSEIPSLPLFFPFSILAELSRPLMTWGTNVNCLDFHAINLIYCSGIVLKKFCYMIIKVGLL